MLLLLPFSTISHEFARALYSPGQNLTKWKDEMIGQCTTVVMGVGGSRGTHWWGSQVPGSRSGLVSSSQAPCLLRS